MSKTSRKRALVGTLLVAGSALAGAGLHAGLVTTERAFAAERTMAPTVAPMSTASEAERAAVNLSDAFADLAEQVTPSVVQIQVVMDEAPQEASSPIPEEFRRFFNMPLEAPRNRGPIMGGGSGFLVSSDGYIVTNNHVVGDADEITVTLNDHRAFDATVVGTDPTTDVAVIKIDADGLPALPWGSSDNLRVGEWLMAVGNPGFGSGQLDYTVTTGIVSAKGRPLTLINRELQADPRYGSELSGYAIENFIQTDAVINPGNSGGPMLNLRGEVVGVNSAIASTDGHYQGYGFAIPSDLVRKVAQDLIQHGKVLRPWLGVRVMQVTPEDAEAFHLPKVSGVLIQGVTDDSPAADAGLAQGDVIVSVDNQDVSSGGELQEIIAVRDQGEKVSVTYYRDGKARTAEVKLGEAPVNDRATAERGNRHASSSTAQRLGLEVRPLTPDLAQQLGYDQADGVVIAQVDPIGPSAGRGVIPGLKLTKVGDTDIHSGKDVALALSMAGEGQVVTLHLQTPDGDTRIANVRAR